MKLVKITETDIESGEMDVVMVPENYLSDIPKQNSQARMNGLAKAFRRGKEDRDRAFDFALTGSFAGEQCPRG